MTQTTSSYWVCSNPSAFSPLTEEEQTQDWGKELLIAMKFAKELDLYRAISSYKRALFLEPSNIYRRKQIEFGIILSYFLGNKYYEAVEAFETSSLVDAQENTFPAFQDLLLVLYESYKKIGRDEHAERILMIIENYSPETGQKIKISDAITTADLFFLECSDTPNCKTKALVETYRLNAKSSQKAQTLNAILPGMGYLYVGQKQAALTSFLINTLFITAAYQFIDRGYYAAGIITTSLEFGWYFGGINGAGLAAKEYNERLYTALGKETLHSCSLFPFLMLRYAF